MRKIFLVLLALPLFSLAQEKNVVSVSRYFPKMDKVQQFEKALTAHAQSYHKGDVQWRVFTIESGPDAGGYQVVEGPTSWDATDTRGDLGKAHMDNWSNTIQNLLTDRGGTMYSVYRPDLSTVQLTDYSDKIAVSHVFPKPGYGADVEEGIKKLKKAWEAGTSTVAVYEASSSGPPQYALVTRYKQGLKERNTGFRTPMKERFIKANGDKSWDEYIQMQRNAIDHSWSELLFYRKELSSK
jgi:hypothetical protein